MSLHDIRQVDADEYWQELRRRWGALLSYRYIGRQFSSMNQVADAAVTIRHDMRNRAGGIMIAPLAIISPAGGTRSDLEAVPNPVIHSLQILDAGLGVRAVEVLGEELKHGRSMGFSRTRVVDTDDHDRVIACVDSMGVSIGDVPPGLQKFDDDAVMEIADSPDLPPLWEVFGAKRRNDGHWVLPELRAELASPDAALHLGPQHVLLETAAIELASAAEGTEHLLPESAHVMFLSRGKVGPFRVDGTAVRGAPGSGRIGVQLTICDEGNGDRKVTSSTMVFRTAGGEAI